VLIDDEEQFITPPSTSRLKGVGKAGRGKKLLFIIDDANGDIATSRDIERDDMGVYTLLIAISDAGLPRRLTTTQIIIIVNVTVQHPGGQLAPPATVVGDENEYTLPLIIGICCLVVLLKLVIVGALCARHYFTLRVHSTGAGTAQHKVSADHQDDAEANDTAAKSSVWKRLHGDHRSDVIGIAVQ